MEDHDCAFRLALEWSEWTPRGSLRERLARRVPVCTVCGREQPARRPRRPVAREEEAVRPEAAPLTDSAGREVAATLLRRSEGAGRGDVTVPARGLLTDLGRRGHPASVVEERLEAQLRAGWLRLGWRLGRPARELASVTLLDRAALGEHAYPGELARRREALTMARAAVVPLTHPKAREVARLLAAAEAEGYPARLLGALAAVALHAEAGEALAERVFSTRYLGDSKALAAVRGRLERMVGPLTDLGVREGAALTLLGGAGRLRFPNAVGEPFVDLAALPPFLGLTRETLAKIQVIDFPGGGLFVVENLAPFEACCRGEVAAARGCLVAWSAGYPGRAVRRLVEAAAGAAAAVRVWADLDLDGVAIARLVASWAPERVEPYCMSPADVASARVKRPLSPRAEAAIRADLAERPQALLGETLAVLLDGKCWVEQEVFL